MENDMEQILVNLPGLIFFGVLTYVLLQE